MFRNVKWIAGCFLLLMTACGGAANTGPSAIVTSASEINVPGTPRELLNFAQLMDGFDYETPVLEEAFKRPADAMSPVHVFEGRLELLGEEKIGFYEIVRGGASIPVDMYHLPEFDFEFVQGAGTLIPVQRGRIVTEHPTWNYIIGPGEVWQEAGDAGYSRASFPFALVPKGGNSTYNGTMMFLFDDGGVSKVWYQITQEISFYGRYNFWGLLAAEYHPAAVANAAEIKAAFALEMANRMPTKPIEQLAVDYPEIKLSAFGDGVHPDHMSAYGFVVDGVNYVSDCETRYGLYTYCDSLRMASWSTAKSAFSQVALMRLAQEYGIEAADALVKDYVAEAADSRGDWSAVTFDDVLDMATGNFVSSNFMQDEGDFSGPFWQYEDYGHKIEAAFDWPNSAAPGTVWVYRTPDTLIAISAMQHYLQAQTSPDADLFEYVRESVYEPIGMGPGVDTARTSDDDWNGYPLGGMGVWWVRDDFAKLGTLLQNGGMHEGVQILHPDLVAAALQQNADDRGVMIDSRRMYNNAFWATKYSEQEGYDCEFWVAQMQGISGVVVVLLPNGMTYYYFSDNGEFTWDAVVNEADKILPYCGE